MSVRRRPKLRPVEPGQCRLCADPLTSKRASWHDSCGRLWLAAGAQTQMRGQLVELHGWACWACGEQAWQPGERYVDRLLRDEQRSSWSRYQLGEYWKRVERGDVDHGPPAPELLVEVDHVRPLWALDEHERTDPRWWLPFNLQLLCAPCHRAKTKREAAVRARLRRGEITVAAAVRELENGENAGAVVEQLALS